MNDLFTFEDLTQSWSSCAMRKSEGGWLLLWTIVIALIIVSGGLFTSGADAGERAKPILIGVLTDSWGPTPHLAGLRKGLQELGYRENEQFVIGVRFTQGDTAALTVAARELVKYGVDIIFASEANPAKAAQMATDRIPIVFASVGDPMGMELIQSFARPGGNITGVTDLGFEMSAKRMEIFREIIPGLKRVLYPYDATDSYAVVAARIHRDAAQHLGIELVEKRIRTREEAQAFLARVQKGDIDGIIAPLSLSLNIPGLILEATSKRKVPTMFSSHGTFLVKHGGLASYGSDAYESGRQAAHLVDKILKGVNPAEIPVEVNSKVELAINLKVAKALGLTISPEVLYQADQLFR